jgi:hypothetical protein
LSISKDFPWLRYSGPSLSPAYGATPNGLTRKEYLSSLP